jgi:hypothetical protein
MAEALDWVARIMAVALEMVLPGLAGEWLDRRFGTEFLVVIGFAVGLIGGVAHLLTMTHAWSRRRVSRDRNDEDAP